MQREICPEWYSKHSQKETSHGLRKHKCKKPVRCEFCNEKFKLYKSSDHQDNCGVLKNILRTETRTCEICNLPVPSSEFADHKFAHEIEANAREAVVRSNSVRRERPQPRNLNLQILDIIREHNYERQGFGLRFTITYARRASVPERQARPKPEMVKALPVSKYEGNGSGENCTICLRQFKAGKRVKTLPCFHQFHRRCIDKWLDTSPLCPICKASI
jgi:hypothetical protein